MVLAGYLVTDIKISEGVGQAVYIVCVQIRNLAGTCYPNKRGVCLPD